MKRILLAGATLLALTAAQPTLAAALFNWSGCYIGVHAGGGWGRTSDDFSDRTGDTSGGLAGGQLGCNYQMGALVLGAEGSLAWAGLSGSTIIDPLETGHTRSNWLGSVTGRAGIAMDHTLIYIKGGGAWMQADYWVSAPGLGNFASGSATHSGWTVGAGLEWAFAANWSVRVEYGYYDFRTSTVNFACPVVCGGFSFPVNVHPIVQTGTLGLNWRY